MTSWFTILIALIWGGVFENIASPSFGFYILPAIFGSLIFLKLPFTFPILNALIAGTLSLALSCLWALALTGGKMFSIKFFWHLLIYYLTLLLTLVLTCYVVSKSQKRDRV